MTDEEIQELAGLEKTCGVQPYSECEGSCHNPDVHETARKRYIVLMERRRALERLSNAYASST